MGMDPEAFFERWLPEAFTRLVGTQAVGSADFSLLVEVESESWQLNLERGQLLVQRGPVTGSTFRSSLNRSSFAKLLGRVPEELAAASRTVRLPRLDAETCRLVANVPGHARLVVSGDDESWELVFGPGTLELSHIACTVRCHLDDLQAVRNGTAHPMDLFLQGKLTLEGDPQVAMALGGLLL